MRGLLAVGCVAMASVAAAQATVRPDLTWQSLEAPHVRVVFEPGLEALARRVVDVAESAYVALARELMPPRGRIDLILADNVDYANAPYTYTLWPSGKRGVSAERASRGGRTPSRAAARTTAGNSLPRRRPPPPSRDS